MTQHNVAATWTWTGSRDIPDWIPHHHWHADRPVIHTADGPRHLYTGWMAVLWTDGAITVASATVADRVYGTDGIAGRLAQAEAALARIDALAEPGPTTAQATEPGSLRATIAAAVDQAIDDDNLDNLTDFSKRLTDAVLAALIEVHPGPA